MTFLCHNETTLKPSATAGWAEQSIWGTPMSGRIVKFAVVGIMLAGEKGIWGSLEPRLERLWSRLTGAKGADS